MHGKTKLLASLARPRLAVRPSCRKGRRSVPNLRFYRSLLVAFTLALLVALASCGGGNGGGTATDDSPDVIATAPIDVAVELPAPSSSALTVLGFGSVALESQGRGAGSLAPMASAVAVPEDAYSFLYVLDDQDRLVGAAFGAFADQASTVVDVASTATALVAGMPIKWPVLAPIDQLASQIAGSDGFDELTALVEDRVSQGRDLLDASDEALRTAVADVTRTVLDLNRTAVDNLMASSNGVDGQVAIDASGNVVARNGRWIPYGIARMDMDRMDPTGPNGPTDTPFWVAGKAWSKVALDVLTGQSYQTVDQPFDTLGDTTRVCTMRSPLNSGFLGFDLASEQLTYADLFGAIDASDRTPTEKLIASAELRGLAGLQVELVLTGLGLIPDAGWFELGGSILADLANDPSSWRDAVFWWNGTSGLRDGTALLALERYGDLLDWQVANTQSIAATMFERNAGAGAGYAYDALERIDVAKRFVTFAGALIEAPGLLDAVVTVWDAYVGAGTGGCFDVDRASDGSYAVSRVTVGGPSVTSLQASPTSPSAGEQITFSWTVEGGTPPYRCVLNVFDTDIVSPELQPCGTSFTTSIAEAGSYTARLGVADAEGRYADRLALVVVGSGTTQPLPASLVDHFDDGDFTANPTWNAVNLDDRPGSVEVFDGYVRWTRSNALGNGGAVGIDIEVDIPVTDATTATFDVLATSRDVGDGCGWTCGEFPANVMLYLENELGEAFRLRYAFNYGTALEDKQQDDYRQIATAVPQGEWARDFAFNVRDGWPEAARINRVHLFGNGWNFDGGIDNVAIVER